MILSSFNFLRRGEWFKLLPPELQHAIINHSHIRHFWPRELVYGAHQTPRGFWMLLQGQMVIAETFPDGERFLFHIGGPGFCFGGASLLSDRRSGVEVTASTKVTALLLPVADLDRIFDAEPRFYRPFAELIMQRYYVVLRCLARARKLPPEEYVRTRLALLAAMWRQDGYHDPVIDLAISQSEAAALIGISRQTLNRYLANLEAEGLIEVCFRSIRILEPDHLGELAVQDLVP